MRNLKFLAIVLLAGIGLWWLLEGPSLKPPSPSGPATGAIPPQKPDILLISIDTLRADHVSCYGHERETSPFIDSLARHGVRFSKAYSTSSWTVPALASMLTATYSNRHGMDQRGRGRGRRQGPRRWGVLPAALQTLPELLQRNGYATFGLTANFGLPAGRGFGRGFDRYECVGALGVEGVRPVFENWIPEISAAKPWFLWLHLFDPHAPYLARKRWLPAFWPEPRERYPRLEGLGAGKFYEIATDLDADRMEFMRALYDSEIREVDDFLREVFDAIPRAHDALVIVTADHGEEFQEHGGVGHGRTLFEESIRVPLIVKFPDKRFAGSVVEAVASLVDILPTILAEAHIKPPDDIDGSNLFGPKGPLAPGSRMVLADVNGRGEHVRTITDGRWKFILNVARPDDSVLFDLAEDPAEQHDLAPSSPEQVAMLREALRKRYARGLAPAGSQRKETEITPEQQEALRALGYLD